MSHLVNDPPTKIGGIEYQLKSVEVCHDLEAGAFVDSTVVFGSNGAASTWLVQSLADHAGTGCYVVNVSPMTSTPNGAAVRLSFGDTGGDVAGNLFGVQSTWTPAP